MTVQIINRELGTDDELNELVNRIRGFDYDNATAKENLALARALKVLADDIVIKHAAARDLTEQLKRKLSLAEVTHELSEVINTIAPPKRNKWGWGKRERAW